MSKSFSALFALTLSLWLAGCSERPTEHTIIPADLMLSNGKIYTMDVQRSWAESVAISQGRIVHVGSFADAQRFIGSDTRVIDLEGKMVLPSFQDVHIHPLSGGAAYTGCPLFGLDAMTEVLAKVTECINASPDASYIRGVGWTWGLFIGTDGPDRKILDALDDTRPIALGDADGHTLWVNSAALELAGITAETKDPEGGEISREAGSTIPRGALLEGPAMDLLNNRLPALTLAQQEKALLYTQDYLHSLGITAIQDAYVRLDAIDPDKSLPVYRQLQDKDKLNLRVVAALYWEPGMGLDQIAKMKAARTEFSRGRLQATAVKIWADGIVESRTAKLLQPYSDAPDNDGLLMVARDEIMTAVPQLDAAGFQVHIHAIGDATVRYALDAFEAALDANGARDSRHLTAHTQLVHPDDVARFAELNAIAGFSPYWVLGDDYTVIINPPQLGPQRMDWMYPIKSIMDTGARVAFGSDWSVSTADLLLGIETAVTHRDPETHDTPDFLPSEKISLDSALAGYTTEAAFANFLDADTGSIEVGKYADLVVLRDNLFEIPAEAISDAKVLATMLEGELVFGALD